MNVKVKSKQEPFIRKMREDFPKKEYMVISPEEADALVASILEEANSPPPKRETLSMKAGSSTKRSVI